MKTASERKPKAVVKSHVNRRQFRYSKGSVQLNFELCLDNGEMPDFIDLLRAAEEDISEILSTSKDPDVV